MTPYGEIIIQTKLKKNIINWPADMGSPRIFIDIQTTEDIIKK